MSPASKPFYLLAAIGLLAVSSLTLRLAWADALSHGMEQASLQRAVQLSPDNPEYRVRLASVMAAHGEDENAVRLLQQAAALNPQDSRVWIAAGLLSESSGDRQHAEEYLMKAVHVDRTFDPKWALANFYYRKGNVSNYWHWAREAAAMAPESDDLADFFQLCLTLTGDVRFILDNVIPNKTAVQERFLSFLLNERRTSDAGTVAERLMPKAGKDQMPLLLRYCEASIEANRSVPAVAVWNALASKKLMPLGPLNPEAGVFLTNGDFASTISNSCFDWRAANAPGYSWQQLRKPPAFDMHFSGSQGEEIEPLLAQVVPVLPDKSYEVSFDYRTSGIDSGTGVSWRVFDLLPRAPITTSSPLAPSQKWASSGFAFGASRASRLVRLELDYKRERGTFRIEGSISLRNLRLRQD